MDEAENGTTHYTGSATKTGDGKTIKHLPGIIDFVKDQGTYTLESTSRPAGFDTDQDGMPDEWETANGLDPNSAADGKTYTLDTEKKWYTNLEVYLNSLVEHIMKAENEDALSTVDEYYPAWKASTGIATIGTAAGIVDTQYYSLQGQRLAAQPQKGACIRVQRLANGKTESRKIMR